MRIQTVKCDVCGKTKGESNRWFFAEISDTPHLRAIQISYKSFGSGNTIDICGEVCLIKYVSEYAKGCPR